MQLKENYQIVLHLFREGFYHQTNSGQLIFSIQTKFLFQRFLDFKITNKELQHYH